MKIREYGTSGPPVVVLHGGPGAPGSMAAVARGLADRFRVLEPFQRGSGGGPLTVARHVADLQHMVESRSLGSLPAVVGHSWGAMLGLAWAAANPRWVSSLVLIGCGTFDRVARARLEANREVRMDESWRRRMQRLPEEFPDPDRRLRAMGELFLQVDSHALLTTGPELAVCDAQANRETWQDMVRLQEAGVYPAAFAAIEAPVLMLHGTDDPHPGPLIRRGLAAFLPQLEYRSWERCGHYPWLEQAVHHDFFLVLRSWLAAQPLRDLIPGT